MFRSPLFAFGFRWTVVSVCAFLTRSIEILGLSSEDDFFEGMESPFLLHCPILKVVSVRSVLRHIPYTPLGRPIDDMWITEYSISPSPLALPFLELSWTTISVYVRRQKSSPASKRHQSDSAQPTTFQCRHWNHPHLRYPPPLRVPAMAESSDADRRWYHIRYTLNYTLKSRPSMTGFMMQ